MMASGLVCLGRFAFFTLIIVQGISLATYPAKYEDNKGFYGLLAVFPTLALAVWLGIMFKQKHLQWLFAVWLLYVVGFVVLIAVIFGRSDTVENRLDKDAFFGPNILKMTLCLSPVLLLLLLSTGTDSMSYRQQIWLVSLRIALDLFDGVEMLEVILEENELSHNLPREFEQGIIAVVCISFLLSPLQLVEIKSEVFNKRTSAMRTAIQIICVNCVFLALRLTLFLDYGKDASIFIAKNGIIIVLGLFEICSTYRCCGCEDDYYIR